MTPEEFYAILHAVPEVKVQQQRLYYDEQGQPLFYTMEDLPGTWIAVTPVDYVLARMDVHVRDGHLVIPPTKNQVRKLWPDDSGTACHPKDICLIVDEDCPHQKWRLSQHG